MRLVIVFLLFFVSFGASAQSAVDLRKQMKRYEDEIAQINRLLASNNKKQSSHIQSLKLVNQKIVNRNKIITNLDIQIETVKTQLGEGSDAVTRLSGELTSLKSMYNQLIKLAYINYRYGSVSTLVVSESEFAKSMKNIAYSSVITDNLKKNFQVIDTLHSSVLGQIEQLTAEQQRLVSLIQQKNSEKVQLEKEKRQISSLSSQINAKNSELNKKMELNRQAMQKLQKQIASFIENDSKSENSTPIDYKLSNVFEQNIGKLPLPVAGGVIVDHFGQHNHPTQPGIKVSNNGVNFACSGQSSVRSVFEGEVRAVFPVASMGNSVMIRHGKFLTVFSGLGNVNVKKGDKVKTGQIIGLIDPTISVLHFQIWNETTVLNPEKWLSI